MTLHQLLHKVSFDKVFSDILLHVPEVEIHKARFLLAFETLRSIPPAKSSNTIIETQDRSYLGDGVQVLWIDAHADSSNIWPNLLGGQIKRSFMFGKRNPYIEITDESIAAELLWQLVAYGFPVKSVALSGYMLHNNRYSDSTQGERIEEICSYIDLRQISGISHEDIKKYRDAKNISWISNLTSYTLPREKASYDLNCFLDDYMWFNDETKTIVMISASVGFEVEAVKIEEFANSMLKNPKVVYGTALLPGIEVMAVFITE